MIILNRLFYFFSNSEKNSELNLKQDFSKPEAQIAFEIIRLIVSIGWLIYPVGYVIMETGTNDQKRWLNAIYNFADLINKIFFGLMVFYAANSNTEFQKQEEEDNLLPDSNKILMGTSTVDVIRLRLQSKLNIAHNHADEKRRKHSTSERKNSTRKKQYKYLTGFRYKSKSNSGARYDSLTYYSKIIIPIMNHI